MKFKNIMSKKINLNGISFFTASLIYVYLSVFIFLTGWVKPIFSIPTIIILSVFLYYYWKEKKNKLKNKEPLLVNIKTFIFIILSVILIVWLLGWSGFSNQTTDWLKHNCVLSDLTNLSWPVYYENGKELSMLTYYIGQYMVPSLIGKLFSSVFVTYICNGIWAGIGLLLAILGIFKVTKADNTRKQVISLLITLFFSTCLVISQVLGEIFIQNREMYKVHYFIFDSDYILQYSSNIILLRWVMPQCIVPWIIFTLLYDDPFDVGNFVILCLPALFYASFSFVGIAVILMVLCVIYLLNKKEDIKTKIKTIFSPSNILVTLSLGIILIIYFSGNVFLEKPEILGLKFISYKGWDVLVYIFFIVSFLPFTILLYKSNKTNPFYYVATIMLVLLPFFKLGLYNDLCMRVSIIPLFTYMILSIQLLNSTDKLNNIQTLLIVFLIIGSISSSTEFKSAIDNANTTFSPGNTKYSLEYYANRKLESATIDIKYNYYTYDLEKSAFYKYLSREKVIH